jgi:aspartate aminotransferase
MGRIGESATLKVSRRAKELQAAGREILDLSAGEPDFDSPAVAVRAAQEALARGFTRYTESNGLPALRQAIAERFARRHGAPWGPAEVLVTVGGKGALFETALALFEAGGEIVIPSPCWVSFPEQVRFAGAEPVFAPTAAADGFAIRADAVRAAFSPHTRAVVLNSPCNPTGGILEGEDLRTIVAAAAERGIVVVYDETYERFLYDGREHQSAARLAREFPDTVVVVGSFSKTYAMTGWRLGYALGPRPLIDAAAMIQSHATSNATSFAMHGALAALREAEPDVERMIAEYQARRDLLIPRLNEIPGVECPWPAGAYYAFPRVSDHYRPGRCGSIEFCEFLLEEAGVAVVPGAAFGADEHIRLSFACSRQTIERAVERLGEALGMEVERATT